jgi:hypothetical protein
LISEVQIVLGNREFTQQQFVGILQVLRLNRWLIFSKTPSNAADLTSGQVFSGTFIG